MKDETCSPGTEITSAWECAHALSYASTLGLNTRSKIPTPIPGKFVNLPNGCSAISGLHRDDVFFFNANNELVENEMLNDDNIESFLATSDEFTLANYESKISENVTMICKKGTNLLIYFE